MFPLGENAMQISFLCFMKVAFHSLCVHRQWDLVLILCLFLLATLCYVIYWYTYI